MLNKLHLFCTTLLLILSALILTLDVLVYTFVSDEAKYRNTEYFVNELEEYPFFCEALSLSPDEDANTFDVKNGYYKHLMQKNRHICSFDNLTRPLQKFVERLSNVRLASALEGKRYLQCGNQSKRNPSGHLTAYFKKVSSHQHNEGDGSKLVINWDNHSEHSFISEDLEYHNGRIKVHEGRFFFLYSSVLVNLTNAIMQIGKASRVTLQICVDSYGYERTLLQEAKLYFQSNNSLITTLAVGGHVYIAKGDTVYVKVSDRSRIIRYSVGNTFGIMSLR